MLSICCVCYCSSCLSLVLLERSISVDVRLLHRLPGCPAPLLHVGLDVEIGEEEEEQGSVEQDDVAEYLGKVALEEERKASVNEECDELSELEGCQVSRGELIIDCQVCIVRYLEEN